MSSETTPIIRMTGIGKRYAVGEAAGVGTYKTLREMLGRSARRSASRRSGGPVHWALRNVSLEIAPGERVGIIGRNGAGKSTLLKVISRITRPTEGEALVTGRIGSLLEVGTGFHPELSGRDNIFLSGAILGMRRAEIHRKIDEIVDFAGVAKFLDTPVKRYSSGMYLRLAFAVAAHLDSDVLLIDEVLAVGDAEFQKKCLGRMAEIGEGGRTVLFVSHSIPAVLRLCPRVVLLDAGGVAADGSSETVVRTYMDAGGGSTAERRWDDPATAPGDATVHLRAVRVTVNGQVTDEIDIRSPIELEVEYVRISGDPELRPSANLHLTNEEGIKLFVTADFTEPAWARLSTEPGLLRSRCRIPGDLLAEGRVYVAAALSTFNPTVVHAMEYDAVSFNVVDRTQGDGVRGVYVNDWPGALRPRLDWSLDWEPLRDRAGPQP